MTASTTGHPWNAHTPCPSCGESSARVVATRDGKTGEALLTVACTACGLGRIDPMPTEQALADWYSRQYRQAYKAAVQPALRHVLRAGRNALDRWNWLARMQPALAAPEAGLARNSLDIGASSGETVALMRHLGWQATGIEPHQGYAQHAREALDLPVRCGTLLEQIAHTPPASQQLVTMFHVLEHLADPLAALRKIARTLAPGGRLFIEVPNATRLCAPHTMFFRAHTLYFTQASLHGLVQRAGLQVVAASEPDADNLRVVLEVAPAAPALAAVAIDRADTLVRAQRRRRWLPYLLEQLRTARPLRKWLERQEEKRTAGRHASARALLQALYGAQGGQRSTLGPAVLTGRTLSS